MSVLERTRTLLHLEADCLDQDCRALAERMDTQLNVPFYSEGVSILPVPETLEAWRAEHRTARKRADRAQRLGYHFDTIDRSRHNQEIHEINTSLSERQGRPMSDGYLEPAKFGPLPAYLCDRHRLHTYGVLEGNILRAYLNLYRVGDLAMVSQILGHGDHLRNDVMYLLFAGVVQDQAGKGGWFYYNRHDSGGEGLRFFKLRLGFLPDEIEWAL